MDTQRHRVADGWCALLSPAHVRAVYEVVSGQRWELLPHRGVTLGQLHTILETLFHSDEVVTSAMKPTSSSADATHAPAQRLEDVVTVVRLPVPTEEDFFGEGKRTNPLADDDGAYGDAHGDAYAPPPPPPHAVPQGAAVASASTSARGHPERQPTSEAASVVHSAAFCLLCGTLEAVFAEACALTPSTGPPPSKTGGSGTSAAAAGAGQAEKSPARFTTQYRRAREATKSAATTPAATPSTNPEGPLPCSVTPLRALGPPLLGRPLSMEEARALSTLLGAKNGSSQCLRGEQPNQVAGEHGSPSTDVTREAFVEVLLAM